MDIYMGSMTGMDAARKLREARDTAALIFISSSDSFAVESYDVQASYYLLKPFWPGEALPDPLNNPVQAVAEFQIYRADLRPYPCKIPVRSILYVDTYRNAVQVHTTDAGIIRSYNLPEIRRASGGNEMFSLLLQRLYRKYGSHREIHRWRLCDGQSELVTVRKRGLNVNKKAYLEYLFSSDSDK